MIASAQSVDGSKSTAYCEVVVYNSFGLGKVKVVVDFGEMKDGPKYFFLADERGINIKFQTAMDALNYLSKRGWKLVSSYFVNTGASFHHIMQKEVNSESDVEKGLKLIDSDL